MLCENESYVRFTDQPNLRGLEPNEGGYYLVYLDVWERHITAIEDPSIREVALGGPDTASRAKVVWQVRVDSGPDESEYKDGGDARFALDKDSVRANWREGWLQRWQPPNRGMLKAKGREEAEDADPCVVSPEARYRGAENQLYRVEIHTGGAIGQDGGSEGVFRREVAAYERETGTANAPTFKWSRDNGSVTFPIRDLDGSVVTLESLGRDDYLGLKVGDLVEIVDDDYILQGRAEPLLRVEAVDATTRRVTLGGQPYSAVGRDQTKHPLLRRWDHGAGDSPNGSPSYDTVPLREDVWLALEDGIQINFQPALDQGPNVYRTGDYWLIPARTATGDVEWPGDVGQPEALPPHGIDHHYAPLAIVANGSVQSDCRCSFEQIGRCPSDNW